MDSERISWLLGRYVDEGLAPPDKAELEQALLSSSQARELFWEHARIHTALRQLGEENWGRRVAGLSGEEGPASSGRGRRTRGRMAWTIAAGFCRYGGWLVAAASIAFVLANPPALTVSPANMVAERTTSGIAVLTRAVDVEWEAESPRPADAGTHSTAGVLGRDRLRLKSGLLQVEFNSSARVILEGPADFELVSADEGLCRSGKVTLQVPVQARGFRVRSPRVLIDGAGSSFSMDVKQDGTTEVYVVLGQAELSVIGKPLSRRSLGEREAIRVTASNTFESVTVPSHTFQTDIDFERRSASDWARRKQSWETAGRATDDVPGLLVRYGFEPASDWDRTLKNSARSATPHTDGAIVGCEWVEGRWPGKRALEFKRVSDRVRLLVPGEFDSMTLAAWVRVDAENTIRSLMMSEGWELGDLHWQINREGQVVLGVQDRDGSGGVNYRSPVVFTAERIGQWIHLAVVYDRAGGRVSHYVNGQPVGSNPVESSVSLKVGNAELANWTPGVKNTSTPIRNFHGRMDEFLIFGRALGAGEIEPLFAAGQPGL